MSHQTLIQAMPTLLMAFGLGLRHALDPDHLVAVTGITADGDQRAPHRQACLGLVWGIGHALSLTVVALCLIKLGWNDALLSSGLFERLVGIAIVLIGIRLLRRTFLPDDPEDHVHPRYGQSFRLSFMTGLLHGVAGSSGVTLALLPFVPADLVAPVLLLFALATCLSMTLYALLLGTTVMRRGRDRPFSRLVRRLVAVSSILFGSIYAATL